MQLRNDGKDNLLEIVKSAAVGALAGTVTVVTAGYYRGMWAVQERYGFFGHVSDMNKTTEFIMKNGLLFVSAGTVLGAIYGLYTRVVKK
ncbi:hypothetical protein HY486_00080 [Candidatus Woesearchaeota archaeon]|nr:hypothetical protein [Candidatus Woesearchaeota archaeon]